MKKVCKRLLLGLTLTLVGVDVSCAATPQEAEKFTSIAGVSLSNFSSFKEIARRFGKNQIRESGDAATGESSVCYRTATGETVVEFYEGEVDAGFTVRAAKAGDAHCPKSDALTTATLDIGGVNLGMSRASYAQLVGKPSRETDARVEHEFHYKQILTDAELNEAVAKMRRNGYKNINPEGWRKWYVGIWLAADFAGGKLISITVSRSAQN